VVKNYRERFAKPAYIMKVALGITTLYVLIAAIRTILVNCLDSGADVAHSVSMLKWLG